MQIRNEREKVESVLFLDAPIDSGCVTQWGRETAPGFPQKPASPCVALLRLRKIDAQLRASCYGARTRRVMTPPEGWAVLLRTRGIGRRYFRPRFPFALALAARWALGDRRVTSAVLGAADILARLAYFGW